MHWDDQAEEKLVAALLYGATGMDYGRAWEQAVSMPAEERQRVIDESLDGRGPHDAPPRELEVVDYTFEIVLDYGAFREFRRHPDADVLASTPYGGPRYQDAIHNRGSRTAWALR